MNCWKVFCEEALYPGLWQTWYKAQVVAVGWGPDALRTGVNLKGWSQAKKSLSEIQLGDQIVVQLGGNRIGRIGEVIRKEVEDHQWNPTVPVSEAYPEGENGRRILVRWDLELGPINPDKVIHLPKNSRLEGYSRGTIKKIKRVATFEAIRRAAADEENWVALLPEFRYERYLSDYLATYPHHLEDGLIPYRDKGVREKVFPDNTRSDVLLLDNHGFVVVVECKQHSPRAADFEQLLRYMKHARELTQKQARGILVHGGSRKLPQEIQELRKEYLQIDFFQYSVTCEFSPCR